MGKCALRNYYMKLDLIYHQIIDIMSKYFTNYKKFQKSLKNKNAFIKDKQCNVKVQHHIYTWRCLIQ